MDLVGIDVSLAATRSMYLQADGEPRWRPTPTQRSMVAAGRLGRKSGDGFYPSGASWRDQPGGDPVAGRALLERIVAQLVNEAAFAVADGVAASELIDEAMMLGLNHPRGPGGWLRDLGEERLSGSLTRCGTVSTIRATASRLPSALRRNRAEGLANADPD